MGKITATAFITLDNVVQDPHLWSGEFQSEDTGEFNTVVLRDADAMLLGRATYEGFAAAWPSRSGDYFSDRFNSMPKYVVSNTLETADWNNTTIIDDNAIDRVRELKADQNLLIWGSPTLVQSLLDAGLVDELVLLYSPIVRGEGIRLYREGPAAQAARHRGDELFGRNARAAARGLDWRICPGSSSSSSAGETDPGADAGARAGDERLQRGAQQGGRAARPGRVLPRQATRVNFKPGERPAVTDGPFTEAKELVGGYWVIQASGTKEEAVEWALRAPGRRRHDRGPADRRGRRLLARRAGGRAGCRARRLSRRASSDRRAIDAVWRMESAARDRGLARLVRDVGAGRGPRAGRARRRAGAWPAEGVPPIPAPG